MKNIYIFFYVSIIKTIINRKKFILFLTKLFPNAEGLSTAPEWIDERGIPASAPVPVAAPSGILTESVCKRTVSNSAPPKPLSLASHSPNHNSTSNAAISTRQKVAPSHVIAQHNCWRCFDHKPGVKPKSSKPKLTVHTNRTSIQ